MNKAIFLDRDGVINSSLIFNDKPFAPLSLDEFEIIPGVIRGLERLKLAGFLNIVVTNQPDLSTGKQTLESLNHIHKYLLKECPIDGIKVCSHTSMHFCDCRKPRPGMLIEASKELDIDLSESYMIGDRWSDIEAGQRAGCKNTFFIDYGYKEKKPSGEFILVESLSDCVQIILESLN